MSEMQTLAPASSNLYERFSIDHHRAAVLPGSESLAKTLSSPCDDADFVPDVHDSLLVLVLYAIAVLTV